VWKHTYCQKRHKPSQATAISLQRLRSTSRAGVETRDKKTQKPIILRAYQERISLRGLERIFDVARQSVSRWIVGHVKELPKLKDTLLPAEPEDILEYDEAWSFVLKKINKRWLWTVMCRRTRQIIAFVIGDRSEKSCHRLWNKVPLAYRTCISYSDFWNAYQKVLPPETHHAVGKESGQVAHMERWYGTLRQHQARYVRKTLSFSKCDAFHHMVTKWFIVDHNLARKQFVSLTL
jgi:insertion element IS1 protein InsB